MPKLDSKQAYHFYASTAFGWGTSTTREGAIRLALENTGAYANKSEGTYVWSARIELPQTATYSIEYYRPVGVPLSLGCGGLYVLKGRKREVVKMGAAK